MVEHKFRLKSKFLSDAAWNYVAFAVMAATGVILNFFIAGYFGIEALGVFNQIYAIYVVMAQFAVMGFHDSAQKHTSQLDDQPEMLGVVSAAAFLLAAFFGLAISLCVYFLGYYIGILADSLAVGKGIALASPGLLFFSINKVMMGVLNGTRRMRAFAGAQTLRVLVILISALIIALAGLEPYTLGLCFTFAEIVLLPFLLFLVKVRFRDFRLIPSLKHWVKVHFSFGSRALINGFLAESYIRVDIIMLSIFVSDYDIGIYSFAALFIEGLYQVPVVIRNLANPELARSLKNENKIVTSKFCRKVACMSLATFIVSASVVLITYPFLGPLFPEGLIELSHPILMVLISGLLIYSVMIPMDHIFLQGGYPGRQSLIMAYNVLVNGLLNLTLIPFFGLYGACSATAVAFVVAAISINGASWKWLGFKGGVLLFGINK